MILCKTCGTFVTWGDSIVFGDDPRCARHNYLSDENKHFLQRAKTIDTGAMPYDELLQLGYYDEIEKETK